MSYATLMVAVDPDRSREQIVRIAGQLADKFASQLLGVAAIPIRPPVLANGVVMDVAGPDEIDLLKARLYDSEVWFRDKAGTSSRAIAWRCELDFPTDFVIAQARCADLVVVSRNERFQDAYNSVDAGAIILKAGRPALVVPIGVKSFAADRVVIGWKDTREARRAIIDALPFMHEASQVTVAGICEDGSEKATQRGIDDVVQYLAHHRIKSGSKVVSHAQESSAARLLRLARDEGADLLVTGAYGHSRLGEWVFGGVTQELLAASPICCLMSH
ncbi:MAG TPA: universal stress protein [Xanthobacteraceae bacterium]|nr:universal stress protein [Xanthobacteraceae bacterium]